MKNSKILKVFPRYVQYTDKKESYAVNLDIGAKKCKMWRWQKEWQYHSAVSEGFCDPCSSLTEQKHYFVQLDCFVLPHGIPC